MKGRAVGLISKAMLNNREVMRILLKYAYIYSMKARLNLTIEEHMLERIKAYAASKGVSISELVEEYFAALTRPTRKKDIISLVDKLDAPSIDISGDLKKMYYENQAGKYGF